MGSARIGGKDLSGAASAAVIADILRSPGTAGVRATALLRRWRGGLGNLFEAERERWLIRY